MVVFLLKKIREETNSTLKGISMKTGIPVSTLDDWERGKSIPRLDQLEQLAQGLECRMNDLFWSVHQ